MSSSKKKPLLSTSSQPAAPPPQSGGPVGRAAKDQDYFKVFAPYELRKRLRIEAMDAGRPAISMARYCLGILEERLPYDVRLSLRAQADREGCTVQDILLAALAETGNAEAAAHQKEKKRK